MLGEPYAPGNYSDYGYTGEGGVDSSVFSLDYYRNKAREFQEFMERVDKVASAAENLAYFTPDTPEDLATDLNAFLADYDARKIVIRATAEGINLAASVINGAGGRFPVLSAPQGLGIVPFVVPAAAVAAFAGVAALTIWGSQWISGVNDRLLQATRTEGLSPEQLQTIELARVQVSAAKEGGGLFGALGAFFGGSSSLLQVAAFAAAGYLIWQNMSKRAPRRIARA